MFFSIDPSLQFYKQILINEKIGVDAKISLQQVLYLSLEKLERFKFSDNERYNVILDVEILNTFLNSLSLEKAHPSHLVITVLNTNETSVSIKKTESTLLEKGFTRHWLSIFKLKLHEKSGDELFTSAYYTYLPSVITDTRYTEEEKRDLSSHISMLIELYKMASEQIRPKDNIVIHSDTTGIGTYTLVHTMLSGNVTELEKYINFQKENQKVDLILSLENNFKSGDLETFIEKISSRLKADGRIIIKVDLSILQNSFDELKDESAIEKIHDILKKKSLIAEKIFIHRYGKEKKPSLKIMTENYHAESNDSTDLRSLVLIVTPNINFSPWRESDQEEYFNNEYPFPEKAIYINFKKGFTRPSLFRQLVQIGQRIEDDSLRRNYAYELLKTNSDPTERLMLLTIIGYSYGTSSPPETWFKAVEIILKDSYTQPEGFLLRWLVSLEYLIAISQLKKNSRESAKFYFSRLVKRDAKSFCPVLVLKTTQATLHLINIAIQENNIGCALSHIDRGKKLVSEAVQVTLSHVNMGVDSQAPFLWPETADLLDVADTLNRYELTLNSHKDLSIKIEEIRRLAGIRRFGLLEKKNILDENVSNDNFSPIISTDNVISKSLVNEFCKKIKQRGWKRIAIWGTGDLGLSIGKLTNEIGIKVIAFVDSNENTHGTEILGAEVISFDDLDYNRLDGVVITSIANGNAIKDTLPNHIKSILIHVGP